MTSLLPHSAHLTGKLVFFFSLGFHFTLVCKKKRESVHACKVWSQWPPQVISFLLSSMELWRLVLLIPRVTRDWLENILLFLKHMWHLQCVHFCCLFIAKGQTHKICFTLTSTQLALSSLMFVLLPRFNLMLLSLWITVES